MASKKPSLVPLSLLSTGIGTGIEGAVMEVVEGGYTFISSDELLIVPSDLLVFIDIAGGGIVGFRAGPEIGTCTK